LSISRKPHTNESKVFTGGGKILVSLGSITFRNRTVLQSIKSNRQQKHWTAFSDGNIIIKNCSNEILIKFLGWCNVAVLK